MVHPCPPLKGEYQSGAAGLHSVLHTRQGSGPMVSSGPEVQGEFYGHIVYMAALGYSHLWLIPGQGLSLLPYQLSPLGAQLLMGPKVNTSECSETAVGRETLG